MTPAVSLLNPFPGLAPFADSDASRFFGRDQEIDEILDRLADHRLLAVIGVSGCGKSSLVHAGVIPVLRMSVAPQLPASFRIYTVTPGNAPLQALAAAFQAPPGWPATSFDLVDSAREILQPGEGLLLLVDQFEELFRFRAETYSEDGGNAASLFVNLLLTAVDQREVPIYVLLTMRTDFLGECAQFRDLPEALNDCYYLVPRMTRMQQQLAIERPLRLQGTHIHPALVQRLLNDSEEDPDQLPVLQHLLKRLWENWSQRRTTEPIGDQDYDATGGWKNALDQDAETIMDRFPAEEESLKRVFRWITDRGTGDRPVRRPRPFSECLAVSGLTRERFAEVVHAFEERSLLKHWDGRDHSLIDLPHESVMWQWSRLKLWIALEADLGAQVRFLHQSARRQVPVTGLALKAALDLQAASRTQPLLARRYVTPPEQEEIDKWIRESERLDRAKKRRRTGIIAGTITVLLALALVAAWVARTQRTVALVAEARELFAWTALNLGEDPERSLILGLHAWGKQRAMVSGLEQSLHDALVRSAVRLTILPGNRSPVTSVSWSPDGTMLATASSDNTAKVWQAANGKELAVLRGHQGFIKKIAWSPDGTRLATASGDKTARVWEWRTREEVLVLAGHADTVTGVAWSPDGKRLATCSADKTARVWDAATGASLLTLTSHLNAVMNIAWSHDGRRLATAGFDKAAIIWDAGTGNELRTLLGHPNSVASIAFSPDGTKVATGSRDRTAKVWDVAAGRELLTLRGHQGFVETVAWSPDGSKIATGSADGTSRIWGAETAIELLALQGHKNLIADIAWSPDGSQLATASHDESARIWEVGARGEVLTLQPGRAWVESVAWSPDGSKIATASDDYFGKVWDAARGRRLLTLRGHQGSIQAIGWSPDGSRLATASLDKTAKVWDSATGAVLTTLRGHSNSLRAVAWSPKGSRLATASTDHTAKVWDVATGRELFTLPGLHEFVRGIAWSPDESQLAVPGADHTVKVWDLPSRRQLVTLHGHGNFVAAVAWSPDGDHVASAGRDGTAKVWDVHSGRELRSMRGHGEEIYSIAWSPDGSRLATGSRDGTAKVWAVDTGRELLSLRGQQDWVLSVAWSPDGKMLAAASRDKTAQVYAIDQTSLLRLVHFRITRSLTEEECRRYLNTDSCPPIPTVP